MRRLQKKLDPLKGATSYMATRGILKKGVNKENRINRNPDPACVAELAFRSQVTGPLVRGGGMTSHAARLVFTGTGGRWRQRGTCHELERTGSRK